MRLKEKYPKERKTEEMIKRREQVIIQQVRDADFSVPGEFFVDNLGTWCIRLFVYPVDSKDVKTLARELGDLFKVVWKLDFREKEGTFMYKAEKREFYGKREDLLIFIEDVPTPPNCKIEKKTKMVDYFEKVCNQAEAIVK